MAGNSNLTDSARNKQDEFYTQLSMIENELRHYKNDFKGKTVFCNCDDPYESNFFKYFAMNFNALGLKKLITTCYASSPIVYTQLCCFKEDEVVCTEPGIRKPYKVEITEVADNNGDGAVDLTDVEHLLLNDHNSRSLLEGNGDFRSDECIELLKEADIVCTNPPFSLFREYIAQLVKYGKKFLIIGNLNNVTYKDVLPLVTENRMWLGYKSGHFWFRVPESYEEKKTDFKIDENGGKWRRMGNICWFTNLDVKRRHENLPLYKSYSPDEYPTFLNCDAICVNKTAEIPFDYDGLMGVPITFLDKYNPDQFEFLGIDKQFTTDGGRFTIQNGGKTKSLYAHLVIRRKKEAAHED